MFAFRRHSGITGDRLTKVNIGWADSMFSGYGRSGSLDSLQTTVNEFGQDIAERLMGTEGDLLQPEYLNERHKSEWDGKFDRPMSQRDASTLVDRRKRELDHARFMSMVNQENNPLMGISGFAAGAIGNILNPVDLPTLFFPIFRGGRKGWAGTKAFLGPMQSKAASRLAKRQLSRFSPRRMLREGIWDESALIPVPFHKVVASSIDAAVGNALVEIPIFMQKAHNQADYTIYNSALNILAGGAFGGGIRGVGEFFSQLKMNTAKRVMDSLTTEVKEEMAKYAVAQIARGEQVSIHEFLALQPEHIRAEYEARKVQEGWEADARRIAGEGLTVESAVMKLREDIRASIRAELKASGTNPELLAKQAIEDFASAPRSVEAAARLDVILDEVELPGVGKAEISELKAATKEAIEDFDKTKTSEGRQAATTEQIKTQQKQLDKLVADIKKIEAEIKGIQKKSRRKKTRSPADEDAVAKKIDDRERTIELLESRRVSAEAELRETQWDQAGGVTREQYTDSPDVDRIVEAERQRRVKAFLNKKNQEFINEKSIKKHAEDLVNPRTMTDEEVSDHGDVSHDEQGAAKLERISDELEEMLLEQDMELFDAHKARMKMAEAEARAQSGAEKMPDEYEPEAIKQAGECARIS